MIQYITWFAGRSNKGHYQTNCPTNLQTPVPAPSCAVPYKPVNTGSVVEGAFLVEGAQGVWLARGDVLVGSRQTHWECMIGH